MALFFLYLDLCFTDIVIFVNRNFFSRYNVVGRSFFSPNLGSPGPLGGGIEFWRGYYQSLRPTQMGLSLNIGFTSIHY